MKFELIHFPNFLNSFFGHEFSHPILSTFVQVRDELGCVNIMHITDRACPEEQNNVDGKQIVVSTTPYKWVVRYSAQNYFDIDPLFQKKPSLAQAEMIYEIYSDPLAHPDVRRMVLDMKQHEIGVVFIVVITRSGQGAEARTLFSFNQLESSGNQPEVSVTEFIRTHAKELRQAAAHIHEVVASGIDKRLRQTQSLVVLTPREVDCLRWAASGKTDGEIAEILNIARWTVVTYLQNAKIKLGCSNRTSAVATAISLGIISMPDASHLQM